MSFVVKFIISKIIDINDVNNNMENTRAIKQRIIIFANHKP